ncbi:hypothetical protein [Thermosyntropha sp.]|uniref:hypothetical protein n=1 Tax=Thermosyntropha sp. TaxID=2740820 RepID=UPI0025DDBB83|nr:hypothetical protein [Thermosyntropha sp.]MBO8159037.1 hypothetical protein [Thermosyntropha sp.]
MLDQTVIRNILELLYTMQEAFDYMRERMEALETETVIGVLHDTIEAFFAIENSIIFMSPDIAAGRIGNGNEKLKEAFSMMVKFYEENDAGKALEFMKTSLEPVFAEWKSMMEDELIPYVMS